MNTKYLLGLLLVAFLYTGCTKDQEEETIDDTPVTSGTSAKETAQAKSYYSGNGTTFKFRLYNRENDNNNNHTADIYKIIESNNSISVLPGSQYRQ